MVCFVNCTVMQKQKHTKVGFKQILLACFLLGLFKKADKVCSDNVIVDLTQSGISAGYNILYRDSLYHILLHALIQIGERKSSIFMKYHSFTSIHIESTFNVELKHDSFKSSSSGNPCKIKMFYY